MSVTELINKAVEIFEKEFGTKVRIIADMQQLIGDRIETKENNFTQEIPVFEPPKEKQVSDSKVGIKQRVINFLADKPILRKISFIDRLISKEQKALPEAIEDSSKQIEHNKFVDEISNNGEYRKLSLGQRIKGIAIDPINLKGISEIEKIEPKSMADSKKVEQMRRKMEGKSIEDD